MLSRVREGLEPIGLDRFKSVLLDLVHDGRYRRLILSGAEVTTFDELDKYLAVAASLGWFERIQIQTNGRRLRDSQYLKHLIDCGVNEFFVSIHGLQKVHDELAGRTGAFEETIEGLVNLGELDVNVISNTVLTRNNLNDIPSLLAILCSERVSELHLWNYFPMESTDTRDLVVGMKEFRKLLPEAMAVAEEAGKALVLKSFPQCLSMGEPGFFDSKFPVTVLPDPFWRQFAESGFGACIHRAGGECRNQECWGLSKAHVRKYGDERDLLKPMV
jgi:MoaA/NifB/PqqE/SkfB family radical SAM enzyme